jgi:hypothetical protein
MAVLLMKIVLAPGLVAATTLAGRRWGALVAGVVGGFPAVVGPILLALDLEHGDAFAARSAAGALAGLVSLTSFVVVYAWMARRLRWPATLVLSWTAFAAATAALDGIYPSPPVALPLVLLSFAAGYAVLPRSRLDAPEPSTPDWDLALRVVATAAFVLVLTGVAGALGPQLSGLLAAFPVLASVLCAFTHAQEGATAVADFLRGLVTGLGGFAAFCFVVAELLPHTGTVAAFATGTVVALAVNGALAARALAASRVAPS